MDHLRSRGAGQPAARPSPPAATVDAIRFAVVSNAPLRAGNGVLLADEVHRIVTSALDGGRREALGHDKRGSHHQHAHWVPLAGDPEGGALVDS